MIFDAYDQEFSSLNQDISKNISEFRTYADEDKSLQVGRHVEALFAQATDLIKQMELEVRSNDQSTRKTLNDKVNAYKNSLSAMKIEYEAARNQFQKSTLLAGSKNNEQRQRLLDTNAK